MEQKQLLAQMIRFNKAAFDNSLNTLVMLQEQTEKMTGEFLERSTGLPEEGKKAIRQWIDAYQQGCGNFKKHVDEAYKRVEAFLES